MADRVARYQTDEQTEHVYAHAANCCSWFECGLPLLYIILRFDPPWFFVVVSSIFVSYCPCDRSLVAWVDDDLALPVCNYLKYLLQRWNTVDERRTERADRVTRYHTDYQPWVKPGYMLFAPQTVSAT